MNLKNLYLRVGNYSIKLLEKWIVLKNEIDVMKYRDNKQIIEWEDYLKLCA